MSHDDMVDQAAKVLSRAWKNIHTNESLGYQRMLAGALADAGLLAQPTDKIALDRWLEQVKAEAWEEGFADGVNHDLGDWENAPSIINNPYRKERDA